VSRRQCFLRFRRKREGEKREKEEMSASIEGRERLK
jgi:hypothetical protein